MITLLLHGSVREDGRINAKVYSGPDASRTDCIGEFEIDERQWHELCSALLIAGAKSKGMIEVLVEGRGVVVGQGTPRRWTIRPRCTAA